MFLFRFFFILFVYRKIRLQAFRQFTAGEHHAMLTPLAFQADIRAEANHCPLVGTAWMGLSQSQMVIQLQIREHDRIIPP